ncbi:MAG: 30S ribosomal protein S20 [Oligoflexia bacterium]|nr:30S ribosomal protein S20 [Oligoflexia bacterium]
MANHKSAKKRARQNIGRNERNKANRSRAKSVLLQARKAVESQDVTQSQLELKRAQSMLAKAAQAGAGSKKAASRKTSRLAIKVNALA